MAKYSYETKKKVVLAYQSGEGGFKYVAKKYNVTSAMVIKWVEAYRKLGNEGLLRSRKRKTYAFDFKLHMVELYLSTETSYQELALSAEINNPTLIAKWVNDYRAAGPDALKPKRKGRRKILENSNNSSKSELTSSEPVDTSLEHIKQLEDELLKLRIENAYLKELRRLRLEEEALLKKQRELSTASEENSN